MLVSIPFSSSFINAVEAESTVVCCDDAHPGGIVSYWWLNRTTVTILSTFLVEDSSNAVIANSITSQETVGCGVWGVFGQVQFLNQTGVLS